MQTVEEPEAAAVPPVRLRRSQPCRDRTHQFSTRSAGHALALAACYLAGLSALPVPAPACPAAAADVGDVGVAYVAAVACPVGIPYRRQSLVAAALVPGAVGPARGPWPAAGASALARAEVGCDMGASQRPDAVVRNLDAADVFAAAVAVAAADDDAVAVAAVEAAGGALVPSLFPAHRKGKAEDQHRGFGCGGQARTHACRPVVGRQAQQVVQPPPTLVCARYAVLHCPMIVQVPLMLSVGVSVVVAVRTLAVVDDVVAVPAKSCPD